MKKFFVVLAPEMTPVQEGAFALNLSGIEWWHHLPGCWLIVDYNGRLDAGSIRDYLKNIDDGIHSAVLRVNPHENWATFMSKTPNRISAEWLRAHWKADPPVEKK